MQDIADVAAQEDPVVDVGLPKLKVGIALERSQVLARAGDEVVQRDHPHAAPEKRVAQVRADETGPARDYGARLIPLQFPSTGTHARASPRHHRRCDPPPRPSSSLTPSCG